MKRTILVTGATGFLGNRLVTDLTQMANFAKIIATGRNMDAGKRLEKIGAIFKPGDIRSPKFCEEIVLSNNVDTIIHCAAKVRLGGKASDFYKTNVESTEFLLDALKAKHKGQFILISSPIIFFNRHHRFGVREDDPVSNHFVNKYALSKWQAEQVVNDARQKGMDVMIFRSRFLIGKGDRVIMPRAISAHRKGLFKVLGSGRHLLDITSVGNLTHAIILALNAPQSSWGHAYHITNGNPLLFWRFFNEVFVEIGLPPVGRCANTKPFIYLAKTCESIHRVYPYWEPLFTNYTLGLLSTSLTCSIQKAEKLLKYKPIQSNADTISEFTNWWNSEGRYQHID